MATLLQLSVTFAQTKQEVVRALAAGRRNVVGYGSLNFTFSFGFYHFILDPDEHQGRVPHGSRAGEL